MLDTGERERNDDAKRGLEYRAWTGLHIPYLCSFLSKSLTRPGVLCAVRLAIFRPINWRRNLQPTVGWGNTTAQVSAHQKNVAGPNRDPRPPVRALFIGFRQNLGSQRTKCTCLWIKRSVVGLCKSFPRHTPLHVVTSGDGSDNRLHWPVPKP